MKKLISIIMVIGILIGMVPIGVHAEEETIYEDIVFNLADKKYYVEGIEKGSFEYLENKYLTYVPELNKCHIVTIKGKDYIDINKISMWYDYDIEVTGSAITLYNKFANSEMIVKGKIDVSKYEHKCIGDNTYIIKVKSKDEMKKISNMNLEIADYNITCKSAALSWGNTEINADGFKNSLAISGKDVTVAVLDTGIESSHEMLKNRVVGGRDFTGSGNWNDGNGHGTHVAGIIADCTNNNVKIMPIKVLDNKGRGKVSNIGAAIKYAVDNGAEIINLSLGGFGYSAYLEQNIEYAYNKGVPVVVAAGNEGGNVNSYCPANVEKAITVSSIDSNHNRSVFSNYGKWIDYAAPGSNINSAYIGNTYKSMSGTSMATPFVSASLAMLKVSGLSDPVSYLHDNAVDYGNTGWDVNYGYGVVKLVNIKGVNNPVVSKPEIPVATPTPKPKKAVGIEFSNSEIEIEVGQAVNFGVNLIYDDGSKEDISNQFTYSYKFVESAGNVGNYYNTLYGLTPGVTRIEFDRIPEGVSKKNSLKVVVSGAKEKKYSDEDERRGNTTSNLASYRSKGRMVSGDNGIIYFISNCKLYKFDTKNDMTELLGDRGYAYLNYWNGKLYYWGGANIYCYTDNDKKITNNIGSSGSYCPFSIYDGYGYYGLVNNVGSGIIIHKTNLETGEDKEIIKMSKMWDGAENYVIYNNKIYYTDTVQTHGYKVADYGIYSYDIATGKVEFVIDGNYHNMIIHDNNIYAINGYGNISKINLNNTNFKANIMYKNDYKQLYSKYSFNIIDNKIYYNCANKYVILDLNGNIISESINDFKNNHYYETKYGGYYLWGDTIKKI